MQPVNSPYDFVQDHINSDHSNKIRNRRSNEHRNKRRYLMSRREGDKHDLVLIFLDVLN